jgi:hypothetical protein
MPYPVRLAAFAALVGLLAACGSQPPSRSVGSTPIGTDASTGRPSLTSMGVGPGGINRNYYTGGDPNFPEPQASGRR